MKIFQNEGTWLINVSEEPGLIMEGAFQLLVKIENLLTSHLRQIKICFMIVPVSGMAIMASVKWRTDARDSPNLTLE